MTKLISGFCALALVAAACGSSSSSPSDDVVADDTVPGAESDGSGDQADSPDPAAAESDGAGSDELTPASPDGPDPALPAVDLPGDGDVVLSVNGEELTGAELSVALDEWAAAFASDETATVRAGDGFAPGFVAFVLTQHVQLAAVDQAADGLGLAFDEADRVAAGEELAAQLPDLPTDGVVYDLLADVQAMLLALEPTEDEVADYFEANGSLFPPVLCSRHILHDTVEEADATVTRLADGEDFADVAVEVSTGPSGPDGGDLGCVPEGSFVPEFEDAAYAAEPGEVVGPVETQFGFHVIEVISVGPPALDDVRDQIVADLTADATAPLSDAILDAVVEVDSAFATWDPVSGQVSLVG